MRVHLIEELKMLLTNENSNWTVGSKTIEKYTKARQLLTA